MTRLVRRGWSGGAQAALLVLALGCGKRETEPQASAAVQQTATPAAKPVAAHGVGDQAAASDVIWTMPAGWKEMPARPMRKATYQAPGDAGPAEVSVFYFGAGQGGGVEANITRWVNQFQDLPEDQARRDQLTVSGMAVSTVRVKKGTFSSGMPGGPSAPQENWGMNAAVVETPGGAYFIKMTGPSATVDAEEARFTELLRSLKSGS
jgi:hypothetical protein